jgi:hypothetical protein
MKISRNIYLIIGTILIVVNILVDILDIQNLTMQLERTSFNIGYIIGSQFFLIIGFILLRMAYKIQKKINKKNDYNINKAIDDIGKP